MKEVQFGFSVDFTIGILYYFRAGLVCCYLVGTMAEEPAFLSKLFQKRV